MTQGGDVARRIDPATGVVAGCGGVMAFYLLVALAGTWLLGSFEGCEIDMDLGDFGPRGLGISGQPDGPITVHQPPCDDGSYVVVRLVSSSGRVLWSAKAPELTRVEELAVGTPPEGFEETVALPDEGLDPQARYEIQMLVIEPPASAGPSATSTSTPKTTSETASTPAPSTTDPDAYLLFAATGRFRPADLHPSKVWFEGRLVAPEDFERLVCDTDADS